MFYSLSYKEYIGKIVLDNKGSDMPHNRQSYPCKNCSFHTMNLLF